MKNTNAQAKFDVLLNEKYSQRTRSQNITATSIDASKWDLEGSFELNLDRFPNLQELDYSNNSLIGITFTSSHGKNYLDKKSKFAWKLKKLNLSNNKFEQDLSFLAELTELEELSLANNKFFGSLEPLKNLTKLKKLDISGTDIDSGLEYLPENLKMICSSDTKNPKSTSLSRRWEKRVLISSFCQAAENNDEWEVKKFLSDNREVIDLQDKYGNTALHYAVLKGNNEIMDLLLQSEARVDIKGNYDFTPLHIAVGQEYLGITLELLEKGADPNSRDDEGNTTLHLAAEGNNLELLKLLKKKGGEINAENNYNWSVLHSAASGLIKTAGEEDNWEIIKWLLKQGAKTEIKTESGLEVKDVFAEVGSSYVEKYKKLIIDSKTSCMIGSSRNQ